METSSSDRGRCPLHRRSLFQLSRRSLSADDFVKLPDRPLNRRDLLKMGGAAAVLSSVSSLLWLPRRVEAFPLATSFPDIQFDIGQFLHPVQTIAGIAVQFGVVNTALVPARLTRTPSKQDQQTLANALNTIEANYPFSPSGIFTFIAYGLPYFNRLPVSLVASHIPLRNDQSGKSVLEEAVPGPTDVSAQNPGISKLTFNVAVQIETNDVLFTFRSDSLANITDVLSWLQGSNSLNGRSVPSPAFNGLFSFVQPRVNFVQPGLPRQLANQHNFPFANEINPASSMWMGFVDQQVDGSAPNGATVTFAGTSHAHLTTAQPGDYFDNGSIQHLSHDIDDLTQFYNKDPNFPTAVEPFSERVQYMFSSFQNNGAPGLPFPQDPNDAFTNGGGQGAPTGNLATQQQSAFLDDVFFGPSQIQGNFDPAVTDHHKYRVGHLVGLQRSSRANDGTPLHIRNDGPGLSSLDVPNGSTQPTLEFTVFVPTAEFFRQLRINTASLDYVKAGQSGGTATSVPASVEASDSDDDGLERFLTATRRQNFLIPPRRHRSFPLLELT
jgi:hypothetical protein